MAEADRSSSVEEEASAEVVSVAASAEVAEAVVVPVQDSDES